MARGEKVTVEIETEINDQPVTIEFRAFILPPERDVGIMGYYVDDWEILKVTGSEMTTAQINAYTSEHQEYFEGRILEAAGF